MKTERIRGERRRQPKWLTSAIGSSIDPWNLGIVQSHTNQTISQSGKVKLLRSKNQFDLLRWTRFIRREVCLERSFDCLLMDKGSARNSLIKPMFTNRIDKELQFLELIGINLCIAKLYVSCWKTFIVKQRSKTRCPININGFRWSIDISMLFSCIFMQLQLT